MTKRPDNNEMEIVAGETLTPSDELTFEAGRKLFLESTDNGRDYCRHMISVAASAIPIYLALLGNNQTLSSDLTLIVPPLLFLLSVIAFSWGYYPRQFFLNTSAEKDIEWVRLSLMHHRLKWASLGFIFFVIGIVTAVVVVLGVLRN